jgi:protein-disulfide isomerase
MAESKKKEKGEVVINLDTFAIPIAIIIAGVIVAVTIFLVNRNASKDSSTGTNTTTNSDTTGSTFSSATTTLADGAVLGDKSTAKLALVMYSDYECPYCQSFEENTFGQIKTNYIDTGKILFVYRNFPISSHGQITYTAAYAGECVLDQLGAEKFSEFHSQAYLVSTLDALNTIAQNLGVDMTKYNTCVTNQTFKSRIDADATAGSNAGVTGTPGFVLGKVDSSGNVTGELIEGAYPYATFQTEIDKMLAE